MIEENPPEKIMSEQAESTPEKKPRVALWIATGFGLGYLPIAPGTWGSLGGILVALFFSNFWSICEQIQDRFSEFQHVVISFETDPSWLRPLVINLPVIAGILFVALVGVWAARRTAKYVGKSDPGLVVVDEISGQQITYLPLGALSFAGSGWKYVLAGFILFRIFDIVKPWPARAAEKWPHGWGIMADDWLAGIYAAICLWGMRAAGF